MANYDPNTEVYTLPFSELATFLQGLTAGTYKLNITELVASDIGHSYTSGTLGYVIKNNYINNVYIDLSETVIPNSVTSMNTCFYGCTSLTTAPNIPNSVISMNTCFSGCTALTTAPNIPNSVTDMSSCFYGCTSLTTAPVIPNSVTGMSYCFASCTSLTTVPNIPNSVTHMGDCFRDCTSLTTAPNIPNSVTHMGYCFLNCSSLTTAPAIPNSVIYMNYCFYGCTSLTTAPNIPNSVISMNTCFSGCTALTTVPNIPNSVTHMGDCFRDCTSLTTINWDMGNVTNYTACFYSCTSLQEIKTPSLLKEFKTEEFLTTNRSILVLNASYDIPSLVTTDATTLPFPDLDEYLEYLPANTASTPHILPPITEITASSDFKVPLRNNPEQYVDLSSTTLPDTIINMSLYFDTCRTLVVSPEIPNSVTDMSRCFFNCESLTTVPNIPNSVTDMSGCFHSCDSLTTVVIPNSVTNMRGCFNGCSSLITAPVIPNSVNDMELCFFSCSSLITVPVIPNSVINMGSCFAGCTSLTTIQSFDIKYEDILNGSVDMDDCFSDCSSLTHIYINKPKIVESDDYVILKVVDSNNTYYVFNTSNGDEIFSGSFTKTNKTVLKINGNTDEIVVAPHVYNSDIKKYIDYRKRFTGDPNTLTVDGGKFVLWAKDPNNVLSNVLGGGSSVIDDSSTVTNKTWSSSKISNELSTKQASLNSTQLAAVNSGVTSTNTLTTKGYTTAGDTCNADNLTTDGIYALNGNFTWSNVPVPTDAWGQMVVVHDGISSIRQIYTRWNDKERLYTRAYYGSWTPWGELVNTSVPNLFNSSIPGVRYAHQEFLTNVPVSYSTYQHVGLMVKALSGDIANGVRAGIALLNENHTATTFYLDTDRLLKHVADSGKVAQLLETSGQNTNVNPVSNLNDFVTGVAAFSNGTANLPTGDWWLVVSSGDWGTRIQVAFNLCTGSIVNRYMAGGQWGPWNEHQDCMRKSTTDPGAGFDLPTGSLYAVYE